MSIIPLDGTNEDEDAGPEYHDEENGASWTWFNDKHRTPHRQASIVTVVLYIPARARYATARLHLHGVRSYLS